MLLFREIQLDMTICHATTERLYVMRNKKTLRKSTKENIVFEAKSLEEVFIVSLINHMVKICEHVRAK